MLSPTRHTVDVSDPHSVPSHTVAPIRPPSVYCLSPIPPPCTVTLTDPVPPTFDLRTVDSDPTSALVASLTDPDPPPAVTDTLLVPSNPAPARHRADVSDSHSVPSHAV